MNHSMNLINSKIATAVAALTMVACLAPGVANAQEREASGPSNQGTSVQFDLDTSVTDKWDSNNDVGVYPGAIRNFEIFPNQDRPPTPPPSLSFDSGVLTTSRIDVPSDPNLPVPGFEYTATPAYASIDDEGIISFNKLINDQEVSTVNSGDFSNGILRYETTFPNYDPNVKLTMFIPSTDPGLINSLSGVSSFTQVQGVITRGPNDPADRFGLSTGTAPLTLSTVSDAAPVPEPDATAGLLALGGLGAISLLKRNSRFKRHLSNRDATLSSPAGRPSL